MDVLKEISRDQVEPLVNELAEMLSQRGVYAHLRVVGGAALLLHDVTDRLTHDIDAVPPSGDPLWRQWGTLVELVAEIGARHGLSSDWLNGNAGMFIPPNAVWETITRTDTLTLEVASLETLLAMKMASGRIKDEPDVRSLVCRLGLQHDPAKAVDIAYDMYGEDSVNLNDGRQSYLWYMEAICDRITHDDQTNMPPLHRLLSFGRGLPDASEDLQQGEEP